MCNNKDNAMNKVIDIVVDCCATDLGNGRKSLTREDVLGKRKDENICMTRTILVNQLLWQVLLSRRSLPCCIGHHRR